MTITVFVSVTDHVVIIGIHSYLTLLPNPYSLCLQPATTSVGRHFLSGGVTQPLILERFRQLVVLPGLGCCNFPLTLITGHSNTKRHLVTYIPDIIFFTSIVQ